MREKDIIDFLIRAKKATYAGKGPEMKPSRPSSHDLEYTENSLKYIDTYIGGEKFAGEEALWENNTPFWSMNYCGRVLEEGFEGDFLKAALAKVPEDMPMRGPKEFKREDLLYTCTINGAFNWFLGYEAIYKESVKVYECMFHGGSIK